MSEASVISIFPFASEESKPSLIPASFHIPACADENTPVIITVPDAQTHEWLDITRGVRVYKIDAPELARAICDDKRNTMFGANADRDAFPGLAWLPHTVSPLELKTKHAALVKKIQNQQLNWVKYLVELADDDWTRYHQHRIINDLQRYACTRLGLDREWNTIYVDTLIKCPSCFTNIDPRSIVCKNCRFVLNAKEYEKLTFTKG
jgi:hypothetical protein